MNQVKATQMYSRSSHISKNKRWNDLWKCIKLLNIEFCNQTPHLLAVLYNTLLYSITIWLTCYVIAEHWAKHTMISGEESGPSSCLALCHTRPVSAFLLWRHLLIFNSEPHTHTAHWAICSPWPALADGQALLLKDPLKCPQWLNEPPNPGSFVVKLSY